MAPLIKTLAKFFGGLCLSLAFAGCGSVYLIRVAPAGQSTQAFLESSVGVVPISGDSVVLEIAVPVEVSPGAVTGCVVGETDERTRQRFSERWGGSGSVTPPTIGLLGTRPESVRSERTLRIAMPRSSLASLARQPLLVAHNPTSPIPDAACPGATTPDSLLQAFRFLVDGPRVQLRSVEEPPSSFLAPVGNVQSAAGDSILVEIGVANDLAHGSVTACFLSDLDPSAQLRFVRRLLPDLAADTVSRFREDPVPFVAQTTARGRRSISFKVDRADAPGLAEQALLVQHHVNGDAPRGGFVCPGPTTPIGQVQLLELDVESESQARSIVVGVGLGVMLIALFGSDSIRSP